MLLWPFVVLFQLRTYLLFLQAQHGFTCIHLSREIASYFKLILTSLQIVLAIIAIISNNGAFREL